MGYDKEVEMIALAHEMDLFTTPYAFTADEARAMVQAGCDLLVCHVGLTTAGSIGAGHAYTLDEAIGKVMEIAEAGWSVRKDLLTICHGGPFDEPEAVATALDQLTGAGIGQLGTQLAQSLLGQIRERSQRRARDRVQRLVGFSQAVQHGTRELAVEHQKVDHVGRGNPPVTLPVHLERAGRSQ